MSCSARKLKGERYLTKFVVETHNNETDQVRGGETRPREVRSGKKTVTQTDKNAQCFKIMSINRSYWQCGANNSLLCVFSAVLGLLLGWQHFWTVWPVPVSLSSAGHDVTSLSISRPDTGNQAKENCSVSIKVHHCYQYRWSTSHKCAQMVFK